MSKPTYVNGVYCEVCGKYVDKNTSYFQWGTILCSKCQYLLNQESSSSVVS